MQIFDYFRRRLPATDNCYIKCVVAADRIKCFEHLRAMNNSPAGLASLREGRAQARRAHKSAGIHGALTAISIFDDNPKQWNWPWLRPNFYNSVSI